MIYEGTTTFICLKYGIAHPCSHIICASSDFHYSCSECGAKMIPEMFASEQLLSKVDLKGDLVHANALLREAMCMLKGADCPPEAFGIGGRGDGSHWYLKEELLLRIETWLQEVSNERRWCQTKLHDDESVC